MTSRIDLIGVKFFDEGDEFQRFKNIKDQNKIIVRNNPYNYKN